MSQNELATRKKGQIGKLNGWNLVGISAVLASFKSALKGIVFTLVKNSAKVLVLFVAASYLEHDVLGLQTSWPVIYLQI